MGPDYEPLAAHRPQVGPTPAVELLWAVEPEDDASVPASAGTSRERGLKSGTAIGRIRWLARVRRARGRLDRPADPQHARLPAKNSSGTRMPRGGPAAVRAVRPGDVALLFRALTNVDYYEEALRRYGIDYYLVGGHAFYAQQEIFDIVNLLRALANPCDEVSLAGVLRSPMFGTARRNASFPARHGFPAGFGGRAVRPDIERRRLDRLRTSAQQDAASRFAAATLAELRADEGPAARSRDCSNRPWPAPAMTPCCWPSSWASGSWPTCTNSSTQPGPFDAAGIFTLADFITQLSQFVARQPDEPLAATQPESINAVRLMSIHQSKGLEFPVVVVADLDRSGAPAGNRVAFTPELGPMVQCKDCTSGYDLFHAGRKDEDLAELARLLYVATTRAADYLILAAGVPEVGSSRGPWTDWSTGGSIRPAAWPRLPAPGPWPA